MQLELQLGPAFFDDEYQEASRLLLLDLQVISVDDDPIALENIPDPTRPPITFGGTMRGFNSDEILNRAVRGTVRVMEDGNIRWSFVSVWAQWIVRLHVAYLYLRPRFQYITVTTSGGSVMQSLVNLFPF